LYLPQEQFLKKETSCIGEEVWKQGFKDIRDVISLGKLIWKGDGHEEIEGRKNFD
jgi:hypothetical protein